MTVISRKPRGTTFEGKFRLSVSTFGIQQVHDRFKGIADEPGDALIFYKGTGKSQYYSKQDYCIATKIGWTTQIYWNINPPNFIPLVPLEDLQYSAFISMQISQGKIFKNLNSDECIRFGTGDKTLAFSSDNSFGKVNFNFTTVVPSLSEIKTSFGAPNSNLDYVDLCDEDLSGLNFQGCSFIGGTFSGYTEYGNTILGSILKGTKFNNASFKHSGFNRVIIDINTDFSGASFDDCNFIDCDLTNLSRLSEASFLNCQFNNASFGSKSNLSNANFTNCNFTNADFSEMVNLENVRFQKCNFSEAKFGEKNRLQNVTFHSCNFTKCTSLQHLRYDSSNVWSGEQEAKTNFTDAIILAEILGKDWSNTIFTNTKMLNIPFDLTGLKANYSELPDNLDLSKRNLSNVDFSYAKSNGVKLKCCYTKNTEHEGRANFQNAIMHKANMQYCDLQEANFEKTKLQGANLSFGDFSGVNFKSAVLEPLKDQSGNLLGFCSLNSSNLAGADFSSSYLSGTIFSSCILNGAKFNEATMDSVDFSHAFLLGVYITGLSGKMCKGVIFEGACLIGCFFNDTDFSPSGNSVSNFIDACLQGANFTGSTLTAADFTNAIIALEDGKEFPITYTKSNGSVRETTIDYDKTTIEKSQITGSSFCPDGSNGPCTTDKQLIANDPLEFFAYKDVPNSQKEPNCSS